MLQTHAVGGSCARSYFSTAENEKERKRERVKGRRLKGEIERGRKGTGGDLQSLQRPVHGLGLHLAQELHSGCHTLHADTHTHRISP